MHVWEYLRPCLLLFVCELLLISQPSPSLVVIVAQKPSADAKEGGSLTQNSKKKNVCLKVDLVALLTFDNCYQDRISWCGTIHPRLYLSLSGSVRANENATREK